MIDKEKHLYYLDELSDYKVDSGDPDIRGWNVEDKDDRIIGKVHDFLVHKDSEQVVYLDVEVDKSIVDMKHEDEFVNKEAEDHLILPIGFINIDEDHKTVHTNEIGYGTFAKIKRIRKGAPVERDYEEVVLKAYGPQNNSKGAEDLGPKKGFDDQSDTSYISNFYKRKEFDRSPPFRFKL